MFRIIGGVIGFFMGATFWIPGMIIGAILGSSLGRSIDSLMFGKGGNSSTFNNQEANEAYRKFYEQFNQHRSYANNGQYNYNINPGVSESCYTDIGCSKTDSNDVIKKRYRQMVSQYHPDRLAGKGLSESEMLAAETKFKKIQESYNLIKKEKGL